jgi:hypothetical protein
MSVKNDPRVSPIADCDIADGFIASGIYHVALLKMHKGFADCRLRYRIGKEHSFICALCFSF